MFELPAENVAVLSAYRYRAESVALALNSKTLYKAHAFTRPEIDALTRFRIVLIDFDAGMESTLELTRAITTKCPHSKVIVLGLAESEENVVKLAEAGASGYVPPSTSSEELVAIVQSVQRGEFTCPPNITYALFSHLAYLANSRASSLQQTPILTARERKVLELLSQSLTNKEIAARLCISQYTVKNHVHRILKKLGLRNRGLTSPSVSSHLPVVP